MIHFGRARRKLQGLNGLKRCVPLILKFAKYGTNEVSECFCRK